MFLKRVFIYQTLFCEAVVLKKPGPVSLSFLNPQGFPTTVLIKLGLDINR